MLKNSGEGDRIIEYEPFLILFLLKRGETNSFCYIVPPSLLCHCYVMGWNKNMAPSCMLGLRVLQHGARSGMRTLGLFD